MPYPADTQFGPYKIIALIGSGGMGEVYRARDTRLLRDVALKVLPASFTNDPERLRRFEQEARAVAALNHPNIVSVHDVGAADGVHYIVSELLEGETLRERIPASGMPARKAIELAVQLANGLAAAHDQGIVHRDLKPENIFVTRNGRLKILDFGSGQAAQRRSLCGDAVDGVTVVATQTECWASARHRRLHVSGASSWRRCRPSLRIFSFGSILYEMLRGQRAFKRNTGAETMTAILNEDPPEFSASGIAPAPALERIVRHCLEKQPGQRFQSAHDIAFGLESLSDLSGLSTTSAAPPASLAQALDSAASGRPLLLAAGTALGALVRPAYQGISAHSCTASLSAAETFGTPASLPTETSSTAPPGTVRPPALFMAQPGSTESRPLEAGISKHLRRVRLRRTRCRPPPTTYWAASKSPECWRALPEGGGAPRDIVDNIEFADWSPDGASLAVVAPRRRKSAA